MCNLISDVNNTSKTNAQSVKTRAEIDICNTIEYDVKLYQVKITIVKYTEVRLKGLNFNLSHKEMLVWPIVMWHNKTNLNKKLLCKPFQI